MKLNKTVFSLALGALLFTGCSGVAKEVNTDPGSSDGIAQPLTNVPGDPANGAKLAVNKKKGNCIACHYLPDSDFPGNAGPNLVEAMREYDRSVPWIRQKIVDPKVDNADTLMFTFYSNEGKKMVRKDWQGGKRVLTAQEVEDVIAYLLTFRNQEM
ncbi:MAG: sulfur oxidation c-type cytochrome SoxX [Magnetococcales bacterium]|nr:sulfur oxidation c-type cytochrome SoxX [Magnetococcales bacterium]